MRASPFPKALQKVPLALAALAVIVPAVPRPALAQRTLPVGPVTQQTPVWCWAAVGEMVFRYYGVANVNPYGNFQCGIVALLHPVCNANCGNCVVPAGSLSTMNEMLTEYPDVASQTSGRATRILTRVAYGPLSLGALQAEIDAGRPVVAGISPSGYRTRGVSEHVALVVGYDAGRLVVNDPFPFATSFNGDPYVRAGGYRTGPGQYLIPYDAFVGALGWGETIHGLRCAGSGCARGGASVAGPGNSYVRPTPSPTPVGRSCCTPAGRFGPFNQPPLPVGSACYVNTPYGTAYGQVCN